MLEDFGSAGAHRKDCIAAGRQKGPHRRGQHVLVLEEAEEEKRAFQEEAIARETAFRKNSIPIPWRASGEPTRLIWSSMAISKQKEELSVKITYLTFFLGYPASGWLAFIGTYLCEHPYQVVSKTQANRPGIGCLV